MKDKDETVTADWARENSMNAINTRNAQEMHRCESAIKTAVTQGKMDCTVNISISDATLMELGARRFVVTRHEDQRDGDYTHIRWK